MLRSSIVVGICASLLQASVPDRLLDRDVYADKLRAMWLGEVIANHTGRITEGTRHRPPFLTDEDWGTDPPDGLPDTVIGFVLNDDPWEPDDDTDIEYVYVHLLAQHMTTSLTGRQIADGWIAHINSHVWGANEVARNLMDRGLVPPESGLPGANERWLRISNQLITEIFGAYAPGMPDKALRMADLPIRASVSGHAAHASQFHVVLYSLAGAMGPGPVTRDRLIRLVQDARAFIPDSSKSADIVDLVLADYLANPDVDDWERTRDAMFVRYRAEAPLNGFRYRGWFESTLNLGTGVMALLYGEGDFLRTVQIGTLSGWDSDNGTATMGGLLALIMGYDELISQLPPGAYSDRYEVFSRRSALPDHLPADPEAQDTFTQIAQRMIPIVELAIVEHAGLVDQENGRWLLPPFPLQREPINPQSRLAARSANNLARAGATSATPTLATPSAPPAGFGTSNPSVVTNGIEHDGTGYDPWPDDAARAYLSTLASGSDQVTLSVLYEPPVQAAVIRIVEGDHFLGNGAHGGWFESLTVETLEAGAWTTPTVVRTTPLDAARPFQIIDVELAGERAVGGIRVTGVAGGNDAFVTIGELDALASPMDAAARTFDFNGDGGVDASDRAEWELDPTDVDGDGDVDADDLDVIRYAVCWPDVDTCVADCICEWDRQLNIGVDDLLAYLASWFGGEAIAELDGEHGIDAGDLLLFLACWFPRAGEAGC